MELNTMQAVASVFTLSLALAALNGSPASAQQDMALQHLNTAVTLGRIHHINQKEIKAAELALKKTESPEVKNFAQRMISDHKSADAKVESVASSENIELKDFQPADWEQAQMEQLSGLNGQAFDQAYLAAMKSGHKGALADLQLASASTSDPKVKSLLQSLIPTVEQHEALAAKAIRG